MDVFLDREDYYFFLSRLEELLYPERRSVQQGVKGALSQGRNQRKMLPSDTFALLAYCLMPNHFHLLVLQKQDLSISILMHKLMTGYSKYFNKKYERVGSLFQDQYKSTRIVDDNHLLHVSAYIHNNPRMDTLVTTSEEYLYSSYREYIDQASMSSESLARPELVLGMLGDVSKYRSFVDERFEVTKAFKAMQEM